MTRRIESRLQKLEQRMQAATGAVTIIVVEDDELYGNAAHLLAREAERNANDQVGMVENERTT